MSTTAHSGSANDPANAPDPLATLHRMSTTAGVASQQYVAVNATAIIAVIVGIVSVLAFVEPVLLFIPAAGVVVSVIAWRQIRGSSGTETGLLLALLGFALSAGLGSLVTYRTIGEHLRMREDVRLMSAAVQGLTADVKAKRYEEAYQRFNVVFRQRVSLPVFRAHWEFYQRPEVSGPLLSAEWNGVDPHEDKIKGGDERVAMLPFILNYQKAETSRYNFLFRDVGSGWQLEDVPAIFSPQKQE
jgi:hypothetical protein